jgi:hypothetical protein
VSENIGHDETTLRTHRTPNEGPTHGEKDCYVSGGGILGGEEDGESGGNHWGSDAEEDSSLLNAHGNVRELGNKRDELMR